MFAINPSSAAALSGLVPMYTMYHVGHNPILMYLPS